MSGQLQKLVLTRYAVDNTTGSLTKSGGTFEAMLNPASYSHDRSIGYDQSEAYGQIGGFTKFAAVKPEKLSFDMVLDGTGVVSAGGTPDVRTQLDSLRSVVYDYDGKEHEPPVVRVSWGSLVFYGRLDSLSTEYNLFKPSGEPLRAKVKVSFTSFMTPQEESRRALRSSPDLSHRVRVREGDTLPLLCYRIYKDASYYPEVARFNGIDDLRTLTPGLEISFPPLTDGSRPGVAE